MPSYVTFKWQSISNNKYCIYIYIRHWYTCINGCLASSFQHRQCLICLKIILWWFCFPVLFVFFSLLLYCIISFLCLTEFSTDHFSEVPQKGQPQTLVGLDPKGRVSAEIQPVPQQHESDEEMLLESQLPVIPQPEEGDTEQDHVPQRHRRIYPLGFGLTPEQISSGKYKRSGVWIECRKLYFVSILFNEKDEIIRHASW